MNEQETTKEEGLDLSPEETTSGRAWKKTAWNTDCPRCKHFPICMEQRGACREFIDYEAIKERVKDEIEVLNHSR